MMSTCMRIKTFSGTQTSINLSPKGPFFRKLLKNETKGQEAEHKRTVKGYPRMMHSSAPAEAGKGGI